MQSHGFLIQKKEGSPAWYLFLPALVLVSLIMIITLQSWKDTLEVSQTGASQTDGTQSFGYLLTCRFLSNWVSLPWALDLTLTADAASPLGDLMQNSCRAGI